MTSDNEMQKDELRPPETIGEVGAVLALMQKELRSMGEGMVQIEERLNARLDAMSRDLAQVKEDGEDTRKKLRDLLRDKRRRDTLALVQSVSRSGVDIRPEVPPRVATGEGFVENQWRWASRYDR
ncbi:MAG: hypothetical protein L0Y39_08325 [Methylococcaceae bacterium]|nr:hypothetical protein [Methylococcaceae bacterium]